MSVSKGSRFRISRRALAAGAAVGLVTAAAEVLSFRGRFDHRRAPAPLATTRERFAASRAALTAGASGILHLGHSTHLLALGGRSFLTDPWFYDPAFGALSHAVGPAVLPSEVGALDAILVTHDHADHADLRAMDELDKRALVFVSTNDLAARVRARGFRDVVVLAPWEERTLGGVTVTAVPAIHDIYEIGYVLRAGEHSVYFAGDTRLHPDLPAIAERFAPRFGILPVDGTRLTGSALQVMTPADAAVAARTLGLRQVMPSHAEAYFSDPVAGHILASTVPHAAQRFAEIMARELPEVGCRLPGPGELVVL